MKSLLIYSAVFLIGLAPLEVVAQGQFPVCEACGAYLRASALVSFMICEYANNILDCCKTFPNCIGCSFCESGLMMANPNSTFPIPVKYRKPFGNLTQVRTGNTMLRFRPTSAEMENLSHTNIHSLPLRLSFRRRRSHAVSSNRRVPRAISRPKCALTMCASMPTSGPFAVVPRRYRGHPPCPPLRSR
jgi:hypothetical protein